MGPSIEIGNRRIGLGHPVYIVAELSANHRQQFDEAVKLGIDVWVIHARDMILEAKEEC